MATQVSLRSLFESQKGDLEKRLAGLVLPNDAQKIQGIVSNYLSDVFDAEGEFRQSLTQSEDYILQAAISLLTAQQEISMVITNNINTVNHTIVDSKSLNSAETDNSKSSASKTIIESTALWGAAGGAVVGKLLLNGWGAVFGAIAGVAIAVYLSREKEHKQAVTNVKVVRPQVTEVPIDTQAFIEIISKVCDSVDNLISTFRAQIARVVQKYESQEKPTLDKGFRPLLETLQSLIGYERTHSELEEKFAKKLKERIEDVVEQLDSYEYEVVNYSDDRSNWFEQISSPNTTSLKMVYPAIVRANTLILPGKVFIPA
jgi:hypothetical protein